MGPMVPMVVTEEQLSLSLPSLRRVSAPLRSLSNHKDCIDHATSLSPPRGKTKKYRAFKSSSKKVFRPQNAKMFNFPKVTALSIFNDVEWEPGLPGGCIDCLGCHGGCHPGSD